MTSFSQVLVVLLFQLFPEEFHFSGACRVGTNSSSFATRQDGEFVRPTAGWRLRHSQLSLLHLPPFSEGRITTCEGGQSRARNRYCR